VTKETIVVHSRLEPETYEALQKLAEQDERTLSKYVEMILKRHVADKLIRGEFAEKE